MNKSAAYIAAVIAATLMGCLGFFVRESECSAQGCAFARFFIGLLMVSAVWGGRMAMHKERPSFSLCAFISGVSISLCILFYFLALDHIGLGITVLLIYIGPVLAALGESLVERRMPPVGDIVLILIAACGVSLVSVFAPATGQPSESTNLGFLFALGSGVGLASYIVCNRYIPARITLVSRTFWQFASATMVLFFPLILLPEPYARLDIGWPFLLCIGVMGFAVLILVAYATRKLTAIEYGTISYLEPALAVALGFFLYHEEISAGQWIGFALVILASVSKSFLPAHNYRRHEPHHSHSR